MGFLYYVVISCCVILKTNNIVAVQREYEVDYDVISDSSGKVVSSTANSSVVIRASNIKPIVTSIVISAHTQEFNITLSYDNEPQLHNSIIGKNIGLTIILEDYTPIAYLWLINSNSQNISVFLKVLQYSANDLVPGGCNMEFPIEISPFLKLQDNQFTTCLEFQHAGLGSQKHVKPLSCTRTLKHLQYDAFAYFLEEHNYSEKEYFKGLELMSNETFLRTKAHKINTHGLHPETRLYFLKYPQTGVIYNLIARYDYNGKREAIYVPSATYGCKQFSKGVGCGFPYTNTTKPLLLVFSLAGVFISLFGHKFFSAEVFFFGFLLFMMPSFIIISKYDRPWFEQSTLSFSLIVGVVGGLFWMLLWLLLFRPMVAVIPVGLVFGFLITATILYTPLGNERIFIFDKVYWMFICFGATVIGTIFVIIPKALSIIGSSVVGGYISVLYLDNYIGSSLIFIVVNVIRRAIENQPSFGATNDFPFQSNNIITVLLWILIALFSTALQLFMNKKIYFPKPFCACQKTAHLSVIPHNDSQQELERQQLLSQYSDQQTYDSINDKY